MQAIAVIEHFNVFEECSTSLIACSEVLSKISTPVIRKNVWNKNLSHFQLTPLWQCGYRILDANIEELARHPTLEASWC